MSAGNASSVECQTCQRVYLTPQSLSSQTHSRHSMIQLARNQTSVLNATSSPTRPVRQKLAQTRKDLPLRIAMLNCQSVKASGKPAQLKNLVSSLQADVEIGSESWLNSSIKSSEVFPDGFNAYRRDRPDGRGAGVVCSYWCLSSMKATSQKN